MIFAVLFFVFLICLGLVWKSLFWFDLQFDKSIAELSDKYSVEKSLVYAVIKAESNFNEKAMSKKGAAGLMQIMPDTAAFLAAEMGLEIFSLADGKQNLQFGVYYLAYLQKQFKNENTVLAAYNAGETTVNRWLDDKNYSADGKTLQSIPYPETARYIKRAAGFKRTYLKLHGN